MLTWEKNKQDFSLVGFAANRSSPITMHNIVKQSLKSQLPLHAIITLTSRKLLIASTVRHYEELLPSMEYINIFKFIVWKDVMIFRSLKRTSEFSTIRHLVQSQARIYLVPILLSTCFRFCFKTRHSACNGPQWFGYLDFADNIALVAQKKDSLHEMFNSLKHQGCNWDCRLLPIRQRLAVTWLVCK